MSNCYPGCGCGTYEFAVPEQPTTTVTGVDVQAAKRAVEDAALIREYGRRKSRRRSNRGQFTKAVAKRRAQRQARKAARR